ncbi:hypothetical protein Neosp_008864 [[Neocosmospora] mangrovei]
MSITQQPILPKEEEAPFSAEFLYYLDFTPDKAFMTDDQIRQSFSDLSRAVAPENARDVDEYRGSTPLPKEDLMHFKELHQATTIKDLAVIVASSYDARDVYELHKPIFIWRVLTRFIGPKGINDLLMCVYLEAECSFFSPANANELDSAMRTWRAGNFASQDAYMPDDPIVERMLSLLFDMATIVNRFMTHMYCEKSLWGQNHESTLFNIYRRIGFRKI